MNQYQPCALNTIGWVTGALGLGGLGFWFGINFYSFTFPTHLSSTNTPHIGTASIGPRVVYNKGSSFLIIQKPSHL